MVCKNLWYLPVIFVDFCRLLIFFANSLDHDDPFDTLIVFFEKVTFEKQQQQKTTKAWKITQHAKSWDHTRSHYHCMQHTLKSLMKISWIRINKPGRRQWKTLILSTNVDQKSLETGFSIAVCRPTGDKWQLKTLFLVIFDPCSSIEKSLFDCRLPGVIKVLYILNKSCH